MKLNDILVEEFEEIFVDAEGNEYLAEAAERQFRRYGTEFKRQFRCIGGSKDGRMVTTPSKCGVRKDPKRVRMGKRAARVKKQQRIRKSLFTKRKTLSKILQQRNDLLRKKDPRSDNPSSD